MRAAAPLARGVLSTLSSLATPRAALTRCTRLGAARATSLLGGVRGLSGETVKITWAYGNEKVTVDAPLGKTLLEVAHENKVELEGACGGELACSTCHVVFPKDYYDKLPEKKEEELDMLDLAWGLTDTSRLGCQLKVTKDMDGVVLTIPEESNNMIDATPASK